MSTASSIWARGELCCQLPQVNQQGSPDSPMLMTEAFSDSPILCPKARDHPPDKMIPYDTIIHRNFWMKFKEDGWKRTNLFIIYNCIYYTYIRMIIWYDYLIWYPCQILPGYLSNSWDGAFGHPQVGGVHRWVLQAPVLTTGFWTAWDHGWPWMTMVMSPFLLPEISRVPKSHNRLVTGEFSRSSRRLQVVGW